MANLPNPQRGEVWFANLDPPHHFSLVLVGIFSARTAA